MTILKRVFVLGLVYAISLSIPLESRYGTVWADGEIDELDMVYIPGGEVLIGDHSTIRDPANPIGWGEERPVHAVYISSFYIGRGEMTNQEYCDFLNHADVKVVVGSAHGDIVYAASDDSNSYPYTPVSPLGADSMIAYNEGDGTFSLRTREGQEMGDFPIVEVSWYGAAAYCNWRSVYEGYEPCYNLSTWECDFSKNGYRLPTEHEWEYAARGGLHDPYYDYPWPSNSIDYAKANYGNINNEPLNNPRGWSIHPYLTKAGDYDAANGYGLFDMAGNAWEWCNDWYSYATGGAGYGYDVPYDNPTGPTGSYNVNRVVRGGCWQRSGFYCRVSCRTGSGFVPDFMDNRMGFRIARPFSGTNTPPGLTMVNLLTGASPDEDFTITYAVLAAAADASDADGDPISFRIESVPDGVLLKKNGVDVAPGVTLLGVGESLVWTPPAGITGILAAFTTKAWDELEPSATAVTVPVQVATGSNTPPLLTQVDILTGAEPDQDFTISYDILAAAADEDDADSDPISFRIESVSNGVLKKNGVDVIWSSTLLGSGEELVWSPPPGASGIQEAFTTKVWDGVDTNATAVAVRIQVGSNIPPTLTQVAVISGAIMDQDFTISYAALSAAADEADVDGDAISFRVESVTNGILKKNDVAVTPGSTLLGIGEELVWSPAAGTSGTLEAFTTKAWDGLNVSTTAIPVSVVVDSGELLPQSIPYAEYFSSGLPGPAAGWEYYSTDEGRISVEEGMLRMDDDTISAPAVYSLNEAILHLDLAGASKVTLTLDHVNPVEATGDEYHSLPTQSNFTGHANGDGIAFSNDGDIWYPLTNLNSSFTGKRFDLDAAVQASGIAYTSDFQLKFQQYDNASWPDDGRAFDNILISSGLSNQEGFPDLTCLFGDSSLPSSIVVGTAAKGKVQVYVINQGIGPVRRNQKFDARILARPEGATDDQNDIVLTASENLSVGHLKAGKYKKLKFSVSIPEDFPKDDYYFIVEIDTLNYIEELEENNNTVMTSNTFSVWDPFWDLEADIDDGAELPVSVISGDGTKITLPVSVKNIGNVPLPSEQSISIIIVARPAAHLGTSDFDVFLDSLDNINISNLKPDKYKKENFPVYLPVGMTTEDYVLLVWVDSAEQVVEKDETNNIDVTFPFGVLTGFIDLTAQFGKSTLPLEVVVGQEVKAKIPVIVTNEGNVSVARGRKINIRLIAHPLADGDYVELLPADKQILSVNNLKPGKSKKLNATVIIPADLPSGDYEILTIIDSQNDVEEANENNNIIVHDNLLSVNSASI